MIEMKDLKETLKKIYQKLEDEKSKEIYTNLLMYRLTGDYNFIKKNGLIYAKESSFLFWGDFSRFRLMKPLLPEDRNFVLFGAGQDGTLLLPYAMEDNRFAGFCSSTKEKQKNGYLDQPVISPEELLNRKDLSVIIATSADKEEIMQILRDGGYPKELIFDGPAYYKPELGTAEQYFGPEFMRFEDREVFVDAGCFDFNTSLDLVKHCKCAKVYAFEPDPKNYEKCKRRIERRNKEKLPDAKLLPYGAWSKRAELRFSATADGSSRLIRKNPEAIPGAIMVPTISIDEAIDAGDRVTMIKMDIEGAELEALKGAKETIQRDKPKLAICIYHKPEDIWEIPLYIQELVPEYRFYIRHHSFTEGETVLYAVMP